MSIEDRRQERQPARREGDDGIIRTRATDNTADAEVFRDQRRAYRRLTVVYATFAAGVLGLCINGFFYNQGAGNNQDNCKLTQDGFEVSYLAAQRSIDDPRSPTDVKERQRIARDKYAVLLPKSKSVPNGSGETCKQQFPKKPFLIF